MVDQNIIVAGRANEAVDGFVKLIVAHLSCMFFARLLAADVHRVGLLVGLDRNR